MEAHGKKPILIVGRHNEYLRDLLKSEGIIADVSDRLTSTLQRYKLTLINDIEFDKSEEAEFDVFCKNKGNLIILNPQGQLAKIIGLSIGKKIEKTRIIVNKLKCQVMDAIFYNSVNAIYRSEDSKPLIFSVRYGNCQPVVFSFDLLKSIYFLSHGFDSKFDKDGIARADVKTIVADDERLYPQADILVRCLVALIEKQINMPRFWYFPHKKKCGIIFSHDSDNATNYDLRKISRLNNDQGISTTTFLLLKTGTPNCWKEIKKFQEVQLHQAYMYFPNKGNLGLIGNKISLNPVLGQFQKTLLYAEKFFLSKILRKEIVGIRNHGLVLYKWNNVIRWMRNANLKFDSSLGSSKNYGYLYGHGLPHFLRFNNYDSSNVLEFPLHFMDYVAYVKLGKTSKNRKNIHSYEKIRKLLYQFIDIGLKFNSLLTFDFHYIFLKDKEIMRLYLDVINYAKKRGLLVNNMSYFYDFWMKRNKVETEYVEIQDYFLKYNVKSLNNIEGFSQIVPIEFRSKKLKDVKLGSKKIKYEEMNITGKAYALFEFDLEKEANLEVNYG